MCLAWNVDEPSQVFQRSAIAGLGQLLPADVSLPMLPVLLPRELLDPNRATALAWLARDAWLSRLLAGPVLALPEWLASQRPFGDSGPALGELWDLPAAVAVIPLDSPTSRAAEVLQMWCVADLGQRLATDHRNALPALPERLSTEPDVRCFVVRSDTGMASRNVVGTSWMLGFELALRVLREGNPKVLRALAAEWIVTGDVRTGLVRRVGLGQKLDLVTSRNWLLPADNWNEVPQGYRPRGRVGFAASLEAAWNVILGAGTQDAGSRPWPDKVAALHTFVSRAWGPVVGAALLSRAQRVVLWHTDNEEESAGPARGIGKLLCELAGRQGVECPDAELRRVSSTSILAVEGEVQPRLQRDIRVNQEGAVLFNITQGNRLMGLAAYNLARRHPGDLWLAYRDVDNTGLDYTGIRFEGLEPITFRLQGDARRARVNWDFIFRRSDRRTTEVDWGNVLDNILAVPE
jgi:hypothetical protein